MTVETNRKIEGLVVFLGGAIGGLFRYLLSFVPVIGAWPLTTMLINWLGAFLLAFLGAYLVGKMERPAYWQSFLGTGIMGGFTTFGTMILQTFHLGLHQPFLAFSYLFLSLFGGLALVIAGQLTARAVLNPNQKGVSHA